MSSRRTSFPRPPTLGRSGSWWSRRRSLASPGCWVTSIARWLPGWRIFDPSQEWRRLFSELLGTFFLVLVAAGGGMMGQAFPDTISRTAAVVAPGLMVMAIILFMGKVSGAHLNPAVSLGFSLRGDFPWRRVPGYIVVQLIGATLAALFLHAVVDVSATYGSNYPAVRLLRRSCVSDGGGADAGAGQRDPRHRVWRPERGPLRGARRGRLHRARGSLGKPDLGHVDEPRPHVRA